MFSGDVTASDLAYMAIYRWSGTDLVGSPLLIVLVPPSGPTTGPGTPAGTRITPDLVLAPGATYAFAAFDAPAGGSGRAGFRADEVERGQAYSCEVGYGCMAVTEAPGDPTPLHLLHFALTYDVTGPVVTPEPATLALTVSGLGIVAAGAWRRRRST